MRLIDADEYERVLITVDGDEDTVYNAICALDKMPTIETVKHGRWKMKNTYYGCSVCDYGDMGHMYKYCPNCGAKMDDDA